MKKKQFGGEDTDDKRVLMERGEIEVKVEKVVCGHSDKH